MNIFNYEFKAKLKSAFIWGLSIALFIIFYMAFYQSISKDTEAFETIMASFPKEFLSALGIREGLSVTNLIGYFSLTFTMVQIAIGIQSANYGFSILSAEEREMTADFLLTKPISRSRIWKSKLLASGLSLLITALIISIGSIIAIKLFSRGEDYSMRNLSIFLLSIPIFQMIFLSLGMFLSLLFKKIRSVISLSIGLVIFLYIINGLRDSVKTDFLSYFTPFYYFEPGLILKTGEYDPKLVSLAIGVTLVSLMGSFFIYNKRDIHSL